MGPSPTAAGPAQGPDTPPAEPQLWDDIDPVLLMRLYPDEKDRQAAAMAAGQAAYDASKHVVAAQQVPAAEQAGEPA